MPVLLETSSREGYPNQAWVGLWSEAGFSTVAPQDGGSDVEERPFEGRATKQEKENNSTLPKAVAGERSPQATGITTNLDVFPLNRGSSSEPRPLRLGWDAAPARPNIPPQSRHAARPPEPSEA